ncbi:hypothetical protein BRC65_00500 [Halobacteriales archaeon QH_2_65_14]|nr:MAG: hypothetical protein BRC65_00500 [Halobacteriales archaeon QH_2_65_14]
MQELKDSLRDAFEEQGYDVADVSANRDRVRIAVLDEEASAEELREITHSVVDESDVLGLDVTTESADSQEGVTTVVSFRYRG